jgi:hypothetical protein
VQVAVQQLVASADNANEADDEAFVLGVTAEADGEGNAGCLGWQSTEARAANFSLLSPGTHVVLHGGPTTRRVRLYLPLVVESASCVLL